MPGWDFMDDNTRTYTQFDATGAVIFQRPYTAEENAQVDSNVNAPNQTELDRQFLRDTITALQAEKDRADAVIADPAATRQDKDLGRGIRRTADAVLSLARYLKRHTQ